MADESELSTPGPIPTRADVPPIVNARPEQQPTPSKDPRGVVIVGGGKFLPSMYLALRKLRSTGCKLPVELWHLGPNEFPQRTASLFSDLNASAVDAFEVAKQHPMKTLGGWECKPFALSFCSFDEVLLIDADNLTLRDPTKLFDLPAYKERGALFWPDFPPRADSFWRIKDISFDLLNLPRQQGIEVEAGQVLVNRAASWRALMTTLSINEHSDFFYKHCVYGDTGTYPLGWRVAQTAYAQIPHTPTIVRDFVRTHYDWEGKPLFEHGRKWVLPVEANRAAGPSSHDAECYVWLAEFSKALYL